MIKYGMLKNANKFCCIKLARGIDLTKCGLHYRKPEKNKSNVSMQKYGHLWFRLQDGNALFKTYDGTYKPELKKLRIVNELIVQELARQIGVPCARYEPASYGDDIGLVTYNFLKDKQTLISLADFLLPNSNYDNNLVDIADACNFYKMIGYDISKEDIILGTYKDMVLDALTLQTDRNNYNINYIKDGNDNSIFVSLLFDNEFAFAIDHIADILKYSNSDCITFEKLLFTYSKYAKMLNVESEMYNGKRYTHNIQNLVNLAKSNEKMGIFLKNALKNINICQAIKNVEGFGIEIPTEYKQYLVEIISCTKELFVKELSKPKTEDTTYLYEEFIK